MGLDMYLYKTKKTEDVTPNQLVALDSYFDYIGRPEKYKDSTPQEWNGLDMDDVRNGLIPLYKDEFMHRYSAWDKDHNYGFKTIFENVACWRKANQIHGWFVKNVQDEEDDCGYYEVSKEDLEGLLYTCKAVQAGSEMVPGKIKNGDRWVDGKWVPIMEDGYIIKNPGVAEQLLPVTEGFFFGGYEYTQWYMQDITYTVDILTEMLEKTDFEHEIVLYHASW